jgi:hypothetical protein
MTEKFPDMRLFFFPDSQEFPGNLKRGKIPTIVVSKWILRDLNFDFLHGVEKIGNFFKNEKA